MKPVVDALGCLGQVQRSHSDRATTRKSYETQKSNRNDSLNNNSNIVKGMPAMAKCPKIDNTSKSDKPPVKKVQNKFFQHVKKSQDDAVVPPLQLKKKDAPRDRQSAEQGIRGGGNNVGCACLWDLCNACQNPI